MSRVTIWATPQPQQRRGGSLAVCKIKIVLIPYRIRDPVCFSRCFSRWSSLSGLGTYWAPIAGNLAGSSPALTPPATAKLHRWNLRCMLQPLAARPRVTICSGCLMPLWIAQQAQSQLSNHRHSCSCRPSLVLEGPASSHSDAPAARWTPILGPGS
jgi:hypothetical protein